MSIYLFTIYNLGLRVVSQMNDTLSIKRTHLLNYIMRNGAHVGNAFGSIALIYSVIGVGISFVPNTYEEANTLVAATSTGLLYGGLSQTKTMANLQGIIFCLFI